MSFLNPSLGNQVGQSSFLYSEMPLGAQRWPDLKIISWDAEYDLGRRA